MSNGRITPLFYALVAASLWAAPAVRPAWDDAARVTLAGSMHPRLAKLAPSKAVAPDFPLERMILVLKMDPATRTQLDGLLKDQQDPASPHYHQWMSPDEFGQRFGPSQAQMDAATLWLLQQGFTVHAASRSGLAITFSGTAAQVGQAFRTAIMEYEVDGSIHHGNATPVSIPQGLAGFVGGVVSLHDLRRTAHSRMLGRIGAVSRPLATKSDGSHYLGAGDFAAIYNLAGLHTSGITGAGVTIGIVGRTDLDPQDHADFATTFGLTGGSYQQIYNGPNPGLMDMNEQFEADMDTQWSSATAPGANINLVISASSYTTDGVDLSSQYLVDTNIAQILTSSFGSCETLMGTTETAFYDQLWAQAAGQGISVFVASGDNGAAGCDDPDNFQGTVRGVSGLASTPYNTAVGGTMFNEGSGTYWVQTTQSGLQTTAAGYIPEAVWNESGAVTGGDRLWAGSGGASSIYPKPSWQVAPNVPAVNSRILPDVSFSAAGNHDPYLVAQGGLIYQGGGTSVASPCMAGIMAMVVQKCGLQRQGNPNPMLYALGNAQFTSSTNPAVFHDVTVGTNSVPGVPGYAAAAGYDQATGLGSLDAQALVNNWVAGSNPISVPVLTPGGTVTARSGTSVAFSGAAQDSRPDATLSYTWSFGDGATATGTSASHTYLVQGNQNRNFVAVLTASDGTSSQSGSEIVTVAPTGVNPTITMPAIPSVGVFPGNAINFTGTATTQNAAAITNYAWDFGDGGSASGSFASHVFPDNGKTPYKVKFTATDGTGATGTTTLQVWSHAGYTMNLNGDDALDVRDLLVLAGAWGTGPATVTNLNGLYVWADLNADGTVNDLDLNLWIQNFAPGAP